MAKIIDGKLISAQIKAELKEKTAKLLEEKGIIPGLALLLIGEDPASTIYVSSKEKSCKEIGYNSIVRREPATITELEALNIIDQWNKDDKIHGILVQLPVPKHIDEQKIILCQNLVLI